MYDHKRGTQFLQRIGAIPSVLQPQPTIEPTAFLVHSYPVLQPPLPPPELCRNDDGQPPPDRGITEDWPHP